MKWPENADLLDEGVPDMPAQGSMHNGQRAPHQTLGTRNVVEAAQTRLDQNPQAMRVRAKPSSIRSPH